MELSPGEVVAIGGALAGVAAAWGALSWRIRILEKGESWRTSARDQGIRIGDVEDRVSKLEGFTMGYRTRKKTKPPGHEPPGESEK